jgi:hypothetical protein
MSKFMLVMAALLWVVGLLGAPLATAGEAVRTPSNMPQMIAFDLR